METFLQKQHADDLQCSGILGGRMHSQQPQTMQQIIELAYGTWSCDEPSQCHSPAQCIDSNLIQLQYVPIDVVKRQSTE